MKVRIIFPGAFLGRKNLITQLIMQGNSSYNHMYMYMHMHCMCEALYNVHVHVNEQGQFHGSKKYSKYCANILVQQNNIQVIVINA